MQNRWGKGKPVSLSDLMKITPVANEIMHLSEEMNLNTADLMWLIAQVVDNDDELNSLKPNSNLTGLLDEDWEDFDLEELEDELDASEFNVSVKINSTGRFSELGFKVGVNDKEDLSYFFDMILEMIDKLE